MKIAFLVNSFDRTNEKKFPKNVGHYMLQGFRNNGVEVEIISPAVTGEFPYKVKQAIYKYIFHQRHLRYTELSLIKKEAKIRSGILKKSNADIVFSFGPIASDFLETNKKIAWWTDSLFKGFLGYHPDCDLTKKCIERSIYLDEVGLELADAVFFTSHWAQKTAFTINNYPKKYFVAPFGGNLDIEHDVNFIDKITEQREKNKICKLLLIGTPWKYKGVDIAIDIVKRLNSLGLSSELTIIGCINPHKEILPDYVKVIKFLDKNKEKEKTAFYNYFKESHFFLLPTLTEAFGHVFCEANAFALPCISHKTGGVPEVILDGKNGKIFEIGENIDNWCEYIIKTFEDKTTYTELCLSSFNEYQTRLNWDNGCKIVIDKLQQLI